MRPEIIRDLSLDDPRRSLIKTLDRMTHGRRIWQVFAEFVEMMALTWANAVPNPNREKREARYLEIARHYSADEMHAHCFAHACVVKEMDERRFSDVLGSVFMELDLGSHWHGQFFTPYELCRLMARMATENHADDHVIRLHEPACGAGGMIIASAEALLEAGINPQQWMHSQAIDIDPLCVHMAYVQLSILGLPAVIHHGNTLSGERWGERWCTPAHVLGFWDVKLKRADADADTEGEAIEMCTELDTHAHESDTSNNTVSQLALF